MLHCIAGNLAPGGSACRTEHRPQRRSFAEQQGGHALAGEHLRHLQRAAADMPHLPRQRCQLLRGEPGARQGDGGMGAAKVVQRDGALLRRRTQPGEELRHPAGFIGLRVAGASQLLAEHPKCFGYGAVLLGQGGAHGFGMDARFLAAAVQRKAAPRRRAQRRRMDAAGQFPGQLRGLHAAILFQQRTQRFHARHGGSIFLLPAGLPPPAVKTKSIMYIVYDPAETFPPPGQALVDRVHRLRQ